MGQSAQIAFFSILPLIFVLASGGELNEEEFKRLDTNGDGRLDPTEVKAMLRGGPHGPEGRAVPIAEVALRIREQWKKDPAKAKQAAEDKMDAEGALEKELEAADANGDGKIDPEENAQLALKGLFRQYDSNADGLLSPEEAAKIH